jgi:epsilon-lactone hydrolase
VASDASRRIVAELWQRPPSDDLTVEDMRYGAAWLSREPAEAAWRGLAVDADGVEAEWSWLDPEGAEDGPVVLVFHGGGFIVCDVPSYRRLSSRVAAAAGGRALTIEYRRSPEFAFPVPVEDCTTAYAWVLERGVEPSRVAFFGDSAGGNLCLSVALLARERGLSMPACIVPISPAADLTFAAPSNEANRDEDPFSRIDNRPRMLEYYLRGADPMHPLASPLYADLRGFPPMLVMVGPHEQHTDGSIDLVRRATAQGVNATCEVVDGAFHTWLGYSGVLPEADDSIKRIGAFIAQHCA